MRNIKFRVFNKDTKRIAKVFSLILSYTISDQMCYTEDGWLTNDQVELMQYTGLKDKNGKEMYEGDIAKLYDYYGKEYLYKVVISRRFGVILVSINDQKGKWYPCMENNNITYEIIGNIYENKELLKIVEEEEC